MRLGKVLTRSRSKQIEALFPTAAGNQLIHDINNAIAAAQSTTTLVNKIKDCNSRYTWPNKKANELIDQELKKIAAINNVMNAKAQAVLMIKNIRARLKDPNAKGRANWRD